MLIIPAIDIKKGQCVRLIQGKKNQETVYSPDPSAMARRWEAQGAELIHVVDLDGAFDGRPKNLEAVKQILAAINIPIQLGGGIRDISTIEALINLGVARVILGTKVITDPDLIKMACDRFEDRIVVGIDAQDGYVAIRGWQEVTASKAIPLAHQVEAMGVSRIIFTDIARDGCMSGPNFASIEKMVKGVHLEIIASGGISALEDIKKLKRIGVAGCIIGKALYEGRFDLKEAVSVDSE
ncbi:MAG: 1-(5-phosphoribosyl)-5-[(5-phosphoribosylamino)methylideneamino]imidazole-4-carboxamide isomerase [bacterium]